VEHRSAGGPDSSARQGDAPKVGDSDNTFVAAINGVHSRVLQELVAGMQTDPPAIFADFRPDDAPEAEVIELD
jgi:hypothetical protein